MEKRKAAVKVNDSNVGFWELILKRAKGFDDFGFCRGGSCSDFGDVFPQHVLLFAVSPEAGGGSRETAHKAAEDIGGAESLPETAREVGKHELQGDQESLQELPLLFQHHCHYQHCHHHQIVTITKLSAPPLLLTMF